MNDDGASVFIGLVLGILLSVIFVHVFDMTYKDGQLDAINGKIYYELVRQNDNSTKWMPLEETE
jgi:hypothetical protein